MKLQEIALIGNMRNDAYNAGYAAGYKKASEDITNTEIKLKNEINYFSISVFFCKSCNDFFFFKKKENKF